MLASELIVKLQEAIDEHGDLWVYEYSDASPIVEVLYLDADEDMEFKTPAFQLISNDALSV